MTESFRLKEDIRREDRGLKKIVAINCSPRTVWNTATLVKDAAEGAKEKGAEIEYFDLYRLEKFTGCISCFGCKLEPNLGKCICEGI